MTSISELLQKRLLLLLYILLLTFFSLSPLDDIPATIRHLDKVEHFLAYLLLAGLVFFSFRSRNGRIMALVLAVFLGILLEWGQTFVPGRHASFSDGLANMLGIMSGMLFFFWPRNRDSFQDS
jgi:VanZ family protein